MLRNHKDGPLTYLRGKTRIFSHPVYLSLKEFTLKDFRDGSDRELQYCSALYQSLHERKGVPVQ
ncbi:hypothetical protein DXV24_24595 [Escherichia albertii]|nr:hypothetical protein [Escherichia albertii]